MLRVYTCITSEHDLRLVALAGVICLLAALTAFAAMHQARSDTARRPFWIALAAFVSGAGIWSTHFVAMLAYQPDLPIGYNFPVTVASVLAAIMISAFGWGVSLVKHRAAAPVAGAIIGIGVGTMHYIGMSAVIVAGWIVWDQTLVIASVIIGVVLAAAAVWAYRRKPRGTPWLPALLLTLAICGLHFTAMAAAAIYPNAQVEVPVEAVHSTTLAVIVATAAFLILAVGFGIVLFDRGLAKAQLAEAQRRASLADEILRGAEEREQLAAKLKRQADINSAALNNMAQGLSMFDEQDRLVTYNRRWVELYGIPERLLAEGTPLSAIIEHLVSAGTFPAGGGDFADESLSLKTAAGQSENRLSDGRIVDIQRQPLPQGGWVVTHEDVTEKRHASARIAYLASHDDLTGLPNRVTFGERLQRAAHAAARGHAFALHTIDLDRFKEVNDTLGHPVGDQILIEVAERLRATIREEDVITRLGGDEFALLQPDIGSAEDAAALAGRIADALSEPFQFDGHTVAIGASIGVSLAPQDGTDADELLKMSDLALYRAKSDSRGTFRFFEQGMDLRLRERRDLEADLRTAIQEGQFEVHYQPLLNVAERRIECFEALVRWRHPTRGMVQPAEFIAIAEESGLIIPIGEWVLRQACRDAATWPDDIRVAVNLSPAQFKRGDMLAMTTSALAAANLDPHRLELEITESVLVHDEEWVRSTLNKLISLGIGIAMDDFGTGYSSLSYLRSFPFSKIKIDRSFVADLGGTTDCLAIIQATIQLSEKLGMRITAEGVETDEQMQILTAEGCTQLQGYLISRPIPAEGIAELLRSYGNTSDRQTKAA